MMDDVVVDDVMDHRVAVSVATGRHGQECRYQGYTRHGRQAEPLCHSVFLRCFRVYRLYSAFIQKVRMNTQDRRAAAPVGSAVRGRRPGLRDERGSSG
jgi:hypothetical protein